MSRRSISTCCGRRPGASDPGAAAQGGRAPAASFPGLGAEQRVRRPGSIAVAALLSAEVPTSCCCGSGCGCSPASSPSRLSAYPLRRRSAARAGCVTASAMPVARRGAWAATEAASTAQGQADARHATAACPNHVGCLDFVIDPAARGTRRRLKILTVTDATPGSMVTTAARRIGADDTVSVLEEIVERRGTALLAPIRCDNGPSLLPTHSETGAASVASAPATSSQEHPGRIDNIQLFNGHLRRELLDMESFNTLSPTKPRS